MQQIVKVTQSAKYYTFQVEILKFTSYYFTRKFQFGV